MSKSLLNSIIGSAMLISEMRHQRNSMRHQRTHDLFEHIGGERDQIAGTPDDRCRGALRTQSGGTVSPAVFIFIKMQRKLTWAL
jgi:hypothetical protein